jgi:hypothetical protein
MRRARGPPQAAKPQQKQDPHKAGAKPAEDGAALPPAKKVPAAGAGKKAGATYQEMVTEAVIVGQRCAAILAVLACQPWDF